MGVKARPPRAAVNRQATCPSGAYPVSRYGPFWRTIVTFSRDSSNAAAEMADDADDLTGRSDAMARLMRVRRSSAEDTPGQRTVRRQQRKARSRAWRKRKR